MNIFTPFELIAQATPVYSEATSVYSQATLPLQAVQTAWDLHYRWPWPPWLTLLLAMLAVALVVTCYAKESAAMSRSLRIALIATRLSVVAVVALMLSEITLTRTRTGKPTLCLLVDDSGSMSVSDQSGDDSAPSVLAEPLKELNLAEATRLNLVKAALLGTSVLDSQSAPAVDVLAADFALESYFVSDVAARLNESDTVQSNASTAPALLAAALTDHEPNGTESRLGLALQQVLDVNRPAPPAAIVLLSDGRRTGGIPIEEAAMVARRRGVPLIAVGVGKNHPSPDVVLRDLYADDVVFLDDQVQITAKLVGQTAGDEPIGVRLLDAADDSVLASDEFIPPADQQSVDVSLTFRPQRAGPLEVILEADTLSGELRTDNNRLRHRLSVRKQQIRVLLATSSPSFEYRFLRNLLDRDPAIKLDTVLQEADPEYAASDSSVLAGFPVRGEELSAYDVIILGDLNPTWLPPTALDNLTDFVTNEGGGLAVISGPRFMPSAYARTSIDGLLPIELDDSPPAEVMLSDPTGYVSRLTLLGENTPFMQLGISGNSPALLWDQLPPMFAVVGHQGLRPAARSLAEHPTRFDAEGKPLAVICIHYAGAGQVLFHGTDETWRWRYRTGDVVMTRYWVQAIRHLARTKYEAQNARGELRVDRPTYQQGETVTLQARLPAGAVGDNAQARVAAVVELPSGRTERVDLTTSPGRATNFETTFDASEAGEHRVRLTSPLAGSELPSTSFSVVRPAGELGDTRMDAESLRAASALTSGAFLPIDQFDQLASVLPRPRGVPIETLPPEPLWNRWPVLVLLLVLLTVEWLLRQRNHML